MARVWQGEQFHPLTRLGDIEGHYHGDFKMLQGLGVGCPQKDLFFVLDERSCKTRPAGVSWCSLSA